KQDTYTRGMLREQRETELRDRLKDLFAPKLKVCYGDLACLPALDQVNLGPDRVTLVIFRPSETARGEIQRFYDNQQYKNRVLFLSGHAGAYDQVLQRAASLRAIRAILEEFRREGVRESEPQFRDALQIETKESALFYQACREAFQILHYPSRNSLTSTELDPRYGGNAFDGEQQVLGVLTESYKYREDTTSDSFRTSLENRLWPAGAPEVLWSEIKRRAATDPAWVFHHPRALDDLKDELTRKDVWRDVGNGYIQRGPFPKPQTGVEVRQQGRDDATGEATLTIKPLHADTVYWSDGGPASVASPRLETFSNVRTRAVTLSFLAVDSNGEHETGEPVTWQNSITVRHRFFQDDTDLMCELQAVPGGEIRYTQDGSSPDVAGAPYQEPFPVTEGARVILAKASARGLASAVLKADVPTRNQGNGGNGPAVIVDPGKPAVWKRQQRLDSTGEVYSWIERVGKLGGEVGGVRLSAAKDRLWVELQVADELSLSATAMGEQADALSRLVPGGNLSLNAEVLRFSRGQDLLDLVAGLRTQLQPGEVTQ
ncbi:MAG TPA: chitobiase/beta-hexosaminidase C-terminal domain-containing protein, partial [Chloroflexota bacterium]|nr:chitobiase/beta-hexosaminidase C-terminal domain-containing protein [Chloroflexota bacterium]